MFVGSGAFIYTDAGMASYHRPFYLLQLRRGRIQMVPAGVVEDAFFLTSRAVFLVPAGGVRNRRHKFTYLPGRVLEKFVSLLLFVVLLDVVVF